MTSQESGKSGEEATRFQLEQHLPFQIATAANLLAFDRDPELMAMTDLRLRELRVLVDVGSFGPVKASEISFKCRIDHFTISRAVKSLIDLGLISAEVDEQDKRASFLKLTDKGEALYARVVAVMEQREAAIIAASLSQEERENLANMLKRVEQATEAMLAEKAREVMARDGDIPQDQKDIIKWHNKRAAG
jgi:DNA-binding MarR family transcriptional regulator